MWWVGPLALVWSCIVFIKLTVDEWFENVMPCVLTCDTWSWLFDDDSMLVVGGDALKDTCDVFVKSSQSLSKLFKCGSHSLIRAKRPFGPTRLSSHLSSDCAASRTSYDESIHFCANTSKLSGLTRLSWKYSGNMQYMVDKREYACFKIACATTIRQRNQEQSTAS